MIQSAQLFGHYLRRTRYVTANEWSTRRYLDMSRLDDNLQEAN